MQLARRQWQKKGAFVLAEAQAQEHGLIQWRSQRGKGMEAQWQGEGAAVLRLRRRPSLQRRKRRGAWGPPR